MKISIQPYIPDWKDMFQEEKQRLENAINLRPLYVEHIGSTAVVGLPAKQVIDILMGIINFDDADKLVPVITSLGYQYISKYEDEFPFRRFFVRKADGVASHQIHLVTYQSNFWLRHIAFRDYLRSNEQVRKDYETLKTQLAEKEWDSSDDYARAKNNFIRSIEKNL